MLATGARGAGAARERRARPRPADDETLPTRSPRTNREEPSAEARRAPRRARGPTSWRRGRRAETPGGRAGGRASSSDGARPSDSVDRERRIVSEKGGAEDLGSTAGRVGRLCRSRWPAKQSEKNSNAALMNRRSRAIRVTSLPRRARIMSSRWSCERKSGERAPARVTPRGAPSRSRSRGSTWVSSTSAAGTCRAVSAARLRRAQERAPGASALASRGRLPRPRPPPAAPLVSSSRIPDRISPSLSRRPLRLPTSTGSSGDAVFVARGDTIEGVDLEDGFLRGHGTQVVNGRLLATVCGTVERVNKLVSVRPLRTRYVPETGDVVLGRVTEIAGKRWKLDIRLEAGRDPPARRRTSRAASSAGATNTTSSYARPLRRDGSASPRRCRASTPTAPSRCTRGASSTAGSIAGSSCACPDPRQAHQEALRRRRRPGGRKNHPRGAAARVQRVRLGGRAGVGGSSGEDAGTDAASPPEAASVGGSGAAVGPVDATTREAMCRAARMRRARSPRCFSPSTRRRWRTSRAPPRSGGWRRRICSGRGS